LTKIFGERIDTGSTTTTTPGSTTTVPSGTTTTTVPSGTTTTTAPGSTTTTLTSDRAALIAQANQFYQGAIAAQKLGDWAEYGRQIEELGKVLDALAALN
jgi:uncharacterized membrane protein (UPF0182 family)